MANAVKAAESKPKIFISYSRKDENFAQELLAGIRLVGFEPYLDRHDIAAGEDWEARLGRLIEAADTVVFVISPDSVASERCTWEVERTATLKKRLLPIVWRRVEEAQVPPRLKQLNYIFFDKPLTFVSSLTVLASALRTDVEWIREHTRIGEAALRWDGRGRAEALLLRGEELAMAKAWLASPPLYAPEPTLLHHEFIKGSEDAEAARSTAERQRIEQMEVALQREKGAQAERELALKRERAAIDRIKRAQITISGLFASIIVIGLAWRFQAYLYEQYLWRFRMGPSVITATQERDKAFKPGLEFTECAHGCPTMIVLPAAKFILGSPDNEKDRDIREGPQRPIEFKQPFAVSKTEITFSEWDACVTARACPNVPDGGWGRGERPVIRVSWEEARDYAAWLSRLTGSTYRLLTEAQWEYAVRAGDTGRWTFGDNTAELGEHAWYTLNSDDKTQPVGRKKKNGFGLHDMHGNVWEWVQDCHSDGYFKSPEDGAAAPDVIGCSRVIRGGSWFDGPQTLRSARRNYYPPYSRSDAIGFRVARTLLVRR